MITADGFRARKKRYEELHFGFMLERSCYAMHMSPFRKREREEYEQAAKTVLSSIEIAMIVLAKVLQRLDEGRKHLPLGLENARAEQQLREDAERELRKELT